MPDYTREAEALFSSIVQRHQLTYVVDQGAPVEVLWRLPVQPRLSLPVWIALQNGDELNFGVGRFYTDMFPFPEVTREFASILDAWIQGRARVVRASPWKLVLQTNDGGRWRAAYSHGTLWPTFRREPKVLQNA